MGPDPRRALHPPGAHCCLPHRCPCLRLRWTCCLRCCPCRLRCCSCCLRCCSCCLRCCSSCLCCCSSCLCCCSCCLCCCSCCLRWTCWPRLRWTCSLLNSQPQHLVPLQGPRPCLVSTSSEGCSNDQDPLSDAETTSDNEIFIVTT